MLLNIYALSEGKGLLAIYIIQTRDNCYTIGYIFFLFVFYVKWVYIVEIEESVFVAILLYNSS